MSAIWARFETRQKGYSAAEVIGRGVYAEWQTENVRTCTARTEPTQISSSSISSWDNYGTRKAETSGEVLGLSKHRQRGFDLFDASVYSSDASELIWGVRNFIWLKDFRASCWQCATGKHWRQQITKIFTHVHFYDHDRTWSQCSVQMTDATFFLFLRRIYYCDVRFQCCCCFLWGLCCSRLNILQFKVQSASL